VTRKGISPLIASVLLIAFVMAIASIFATFATEVTKQPTGQTTEKAAAITDCSGAIIEVGESSNASEVLLTQTNGNNAVANISVITYYSGGVGPLQNYTSIDTPTGITELDTGVPASADTQLTKVRALIVDQEGEGCEEGPEATARPPFNC
jgi:flagellin-like protein